MYSARSKTRQWRQALILLLLLGLTWSLLTPITFAISPEQRNVLDSGAYYFNLEDNACDPGTNSGGGGLGSELPTSVPNVWRDLIMRAAPEHPDSDPRLVAATLWAENRGWPAYKTSGWGVSSAGAGGPWQFIPSSWESMGEDGDGDGRKDRDNPADAVHAAFNHSPNSIGKPLIEGETGNPEADYSLVFKRDGTNLLSFGASYNGSGAADGTPVNAQPRSENGDYVRMIYWLIASGYTKTFDTGTGEVRDISPTLEGAPDGETPAGTTPTACGGSDDSGSTVSADGYAFPIWAKKKSDYFIAGASQLPCPGICHHDGSPALDMSSKYRGTGRTGSQGAPVYAISDGTLTRVNHNNVRDNGAVCNSITFTSSKDNHIYWYGHLARDTSVQSGREVTAGTKIGNIGSERCADDTLPHLHISRVPPGSSADDLGDRDAGLIEIVNELYAGLPD